jgi:hypothetical protein
MRDYPITPSTATHGRFKIIEGLRILNGGVRGDLPRRLFGDVGAAGFDWCRDPSLTARRSCPRARIKLSLRLLDLNGDPIALPGLDGSPTQLGHGEVEVGRPPGVA